MADMKQTKFLKCSFLIEVCCILIQMPLKVIPTGVMDNKTALIGSGNGLAPNRCWSSSMTSLYLIELTHWGQDTHILGHDWLR